MPTTPSSTPSSSASAHSAEAAPARGLVLQWRPSKWVITALRAFGPLGAVSLLVSDLPSLVAWPAAVAALVAGWHAARAEAARVPVTLTWPPGGTPSIDGVPLQGARLQWRGPLAFLQWRHGRRRHALAWWPDTLPDVSRRALRLAVASGAGAPGEGSVAP